MRIDDLEQALETGTFNPVFVEYKDGWELQLRHASAEEQHEELGNDASKERQCAFWTGHVVNWRGLTRGDQEVPFDRALLRKWWRLDGEFRLFLVKAAQSIDTFRRQPRAADAGGARQGGQ